MTKDVIHNLIQSILNPADIQINGSRAWDVRVKNEEVFRAVRTNPSLGLGEAYMNGWWDVESLDDFAFHLLRSSVRDVIKKDLEKNVFRLGEIIFNKQKKRLALKNVQRHYDLGNDLFLAMLDGRMMYSCGYWQNAKSLDEAQEAKLDLICRKLDLKPGQKILDIGCGWGGFAKFAAEKYGVSVVGITLSKEQLALGKKLCAGLPVELRLEDYRDLKGSYDHIVSIGMFEHVGWKNYHTFMKIASRCLKDDGLFLLHTIGSNVAAKVTDPWLGKYIFPNSNLPSIGQIGQAVENIFVMEDWHNFGADYDKTLMAWYDNFNKSWPSLKSKYDQRFYRMWKYYLLFCAGAFRARDIQLWQIVLSKRGVLGGYRTVR